MRSHASRVNRTALTVLGLLLLAVGVLGVVLSSGGFGERRAASAVVPQDLREVAADSWWFWPALAVVALIIAYLGWRWLTAQVRTDRLRQLDLTGNPREGTTTIDTSAITRALADEVDDLPGVSGAAAHLRGHGAPRMDLVVDLTRRADVALVRKRLETEVVPRLRQALDDPDLPVAIQLRPGKNTSRDLR